jgi:phosphoribosylformylglycinamidine synthase
VARVVVDVMLKPEILDPAGQAVAGALPRLGVTDVASVRIGKRIEIDFTGQPDLDRAREIADRLLANPVIEDFTLRVEDAAAATTAATAPEAAPEVPRVHATLRRLPAGTKLVEARPVQPEGDAK